MVRVMQIFRGHGFHELHFDFQRRFTGRDPDAIAQAENMRIHCNSRLPECGIEDHIGCFAADSRQLLQRFARIGYFSLVAIRQDSAGCHDVFGFAAVKSDGLDLTFKTFLAKIEYCLRGIRYLVKLGGRQIDALVSRLRGKDDGD